MTKKKPIRIADLRQPITSLDDARQLFNRLARVEILIACAEAQLEKKIATMKHSHELKTEEWYGAQKEMAKQLADYITVNPAVFQDPRKVKTDFGTFGLQKVSDVVVDDMPTLLDYLAKHDIRGCTKPSRTPVKAALKKLFESGRKAAGCTYRSGDVATYKVTKSLIDDAKERGGK